MVKTIFLGTAASVPTLQRSMPSIAVKGKELYLWDCGEGTQRQMMKYKLGFGKTKAVFISHLHLDHFLGLFGLIETFSLSKSFLKKLQIFAPRNFKNLIFKRPDFVDIKEIKAGLLLKDTEASISAFRVEHIKDSFGFIYKEHDKLKFYEKKAHALGLKGTMFKEIQEKGWIKIGRKKIKLEQVSWIKPGKKIVYTGDCFASKNIIKHAENADLLIHEATFTQEFEKEAEKWKHSTLSQAAETAKKAKVKQLILTHLSGRYTDVKEILKQARKIFPNTLIAEDGLQIEIK